MRIVYGPNDEPVWWMKILLAVGMLTVSAVVLWCIGTFGFPQTMAVFFGIPVIILAFAAATGEL